MKRLGTFLADTTGGTAIVTALLAPVLIGTLALGVEIASWYSEKRVMQRIADSAAIGGAMAWASGGSEAVALSAASDSAKLNGAATGEASSSFITWTGAYADKAIQVELQRQVPLMIATLFLDGDTQLLKVRAAAIRQARGRDCILGLERIGTSVENIGNPTVTLNGCSMASNSNLDVSGSARVEADAVYAAGTISGGGNIVAAGGIHPNADVVVDPYADLTVPMPSTPVLDGRVNTTATLSPGTYSRLDFGSQADITLQPGTYIVSDGNFDVNAQAKLRGTGVTIVMTGTSAGTIGSVTINGGADVQLKAPVEGATSGIPGIVMFQDPRATASSKINGGSSSEFQGALYFPNGDVEFTGNSDTSSGTAGCTQLVAKSVAFRGNAGLGNDCTGMGTRPIGGLKAQLVL